MKPITSRDNPLYKRLKALAGSTAQQRRSGQALLEGLHLARAYLDAPGGRQPEVCVVTESALSNEEAQFIVGRVDSSRIYSLPDALFQQLSTLAHGIGMLFLVDKIAGDTPPKLDQTCLVLDGVQDAGNVGSILRSAAAAGIQHVFCTPGTVYAWSSKVLRAGMGAHFLLNIVEEFEPAEFVARFAVDVAITVTDSHGARTVYERDLAVPIAWVFGNEGAGVSPFWKDKARLTLTIPQPGGMESLNVAAAAAVCLFEQARQMLLKTAL